MKISLYISDVLYVSRNITLYTLTENIKQNKYSHHVYLDCRYTKGPWSECDAKSMRSRVLTLKKGESSCVQTRTIQKKCKKGKSEKGKSEKKNSHFDS